MCIKTSSFFIVACLLSAELSAKTLHLHKVNNANHTQNKGGKVFFSNGDKWEGTISITKGRKLQINTKQGIRKIDFTQVHKIKFIPEKQEMEQKWMFPEAGKTQKEKYGSPYPVQYFRTVIMLKNGELLNGHLFSTVLYLRPAVGKRKRIVLRAKQRGKGKETFADLRYPEEIIISSKTSETTSHTLLHLPQNLKNTYHTISVLSIPDLINIKSQQTKQGISLDGNISDEIFIALKKDNEISVLWPYQEDKKVFSLVQKNIKNMSDFFDSRQLQAVYWHKKTNNVYSLTLMMRKKKTSLHAERSNPWRLIIQRWQYDQETGKLLLSGKGWLFRGIVKFGGKGPKINIHTKKYTLINNEK